MVKVKYAVIILNYNTIDDAIAAAESVINHAIIDDYAICIADNASIKGEDRTRLLQIDLINTITCQLDTNSGYASGNDQAIEFLLQSYDPEYIVIMNPDVLVLNKGTIEGMISEIAKEDDSVVGGQPLVWNCYYGDDPKIQQNIRGVPDYQDLKMLMFKPLRLLHKRRYRDYIFADQMPYKEHIKYYVPSGAFFIIRTDVFKEIGYLDPKTFLYYEEHILGYKLKEKRKELLFMPEFTVRHEHGKSTGNNRFKYNKKASQIGLDSCLYYAEQYLGINEAQRNKLKRLYSLNDLLMRLMTKLKKR